MTTESDFIISNPKLVFGYLTEIVSKKCVVSAHFGENTSFLTAILLLDQKANVIAFDCAPSDLLNQQLLASEKVLFRTDVDGVKASFAGHKLKKVKQGDHWMLVMPIPTAIFWLQRRDYFRVKVPLSHKGTYCRLTYKPAQAGEQDKVADFQLQDISVSGMAFLNPLPDWEEFFAVDAEWIDCVLRLHTGQEAEVAFVIKNIVSVKTSPTTSQQRVGCKFSFLPPTFEPVIQRYIQEIELQKKNLG